MIDCFHVKQSYLFRKYVDIQHSCFNKLSWVKKIFKTGRGGDQKRKGFIDSILEKLPEIHIIGFNYCGPNTNLEKRLACNVQPKNELDCACQEHDFDYAESNNLKWRHIADKKLLLKAIKRIYAKNSQFGERIAALIVSCLISIKTFFSKIEICINRTYDD